MKQFFGAFFGSLVGLIVATLLAVLIIVAMVKSSMDSAFKGNKSDQAVVVKPNSILRIKLDNMIPERGSLNPIKKIFDEETMALNSLLKKIASAKSDPDIKGIYLDFKNFRQPLFASVTDIRNALADFRGSGKFIYSYDEDYSQQEYYLASVADRVFLNPEGNLTWKGLGMNMLFFKNTFEKLGIEMQIFRHGKFKSAIEPLILDKMSAANRLQAETYLNSIWHSVLADISQSRKISVDELNRMANELSIRFPEDALGSLIDQTAYEDEVVAALKKKIGAAPTDKIKFIDIKNYVAKHSPDIKLDAQKIAVIYADGEIRSGEGQEGEVGSDRFAKAIREARLDKKVSAIVLRVNSPGGSALASEVIWREVLLAKKTKPVVVSMGDLAASGGYYIACAADRIFAQPNTITGSIGVFGVIPNVSKMLEEKLGITVDTVNTNKYSDMPNGLRSFSDYERDHIQGSVERVYSTFTKRVAEGRNISQAEVDSIGQGRVWSGSDALKIKLVDELGGLNEAIAYAAKKANLKNYRLLELPKQDGFLDELLGKQSDLEARFVERNMGSAYIYVKQLKSMVNLKGVQARLPFELILN